MIPARRPALPASLLGFSALFALASVTVHCASDDDVDLAGASSGAAGAAGTSATAGAAGVAVGGSSAGSGTAGKAGSAATGGQGGATSGGGGNGAKAGSGGASARAGQGGAAGTGTAGTGNGGESGSGASNGGEGGGAGTEAGGGAAGAAGTNGTSGAGGSGEAGTGGSGPTGCCLTDADCPSLPFQQVCAEGICLSPPVLPAANSCWADSECSAQRPKCVAESICGCGEANCSPSKDKRGTCVQGSCCANDDDCEGEQRCLRPGGQGGFGRCSPKVTDGACYENDDCKGGAKCGGQKTCACGDASCSPKLGKCGG